MNPLIDTLDAEAEEPDAPRELVRKWRSRLKAARRAFDADFFKPTRKIVDRYRDERKDSGARVIRRYNIFYANVQTLQPAVYAKAPVVYVSRRFQDRDPVARVASQVLERAITYEIEPEQGDFHSRMIQARDDYLIAGRGVLWARYEATFTQVPREEATPDAPGTDELGFIGAVASDDERLLSIADAPLPGEQPLDELENDQSISSVEFDEEVESEHAPLDFVLWRDFLHDPAPVWQEVTWGARDVLMSKAKVEKRFGKETAKRLKYTHRRMEDDDFKTRTNDRGRNDEVDLALVTEIWDKEVKRAIWISPDVDDRSLDDRPDPLHLQGFFPFRKPLYATLTTDSLVPCSDFKFYKDQANEIDELTTRIWLLTKALAVRGAYDSSNPKLAELLNERLENMLVAVSNWAAFAEKGGLKGQVSILPMDMVVAVLEKLIDKRGLLVQDVFQITGISDIVRGQTDPNETLGAQEIKGSFAALRLDERKRVVAAFALGNISLVAEIIAEHFDPSTIRQMSGYDEMTEVKQIEATQPGAKELLWQKVIKLIKSDKLRGFKLDVETDSTTVLNSQQEQGRRTQFLSAAGAFLKEAVAAMQVQPMLGPLLGGMLLWGVRGFNVGRELESTFEETIQKLEQAMAQPQADPRAAESEAKAKETEANMQSQQLQNQMKMKESELKAQEASHQQQLDEAKLSHEMQMSQAGQEADEKLSLVDVLMKHSLKKAEMKANGAERY